MARGSSLPCPPLTPRPSNYSALISYEADPDDPDCSAIKNLAGLSARRLPERDRRPDRLMSPGTGFRSIRRLALCFQKSARHCSPNPLLRWAWLLVVHSSLLAGYASVVAQTTAGGACPLA